MTDVRMHDVDGIELLDEIRKSHPGTETILITGYAMGSWQWMWTMMALASRST